MEEAIYGRRHVGKCIGSKEANLVQDPQYFGCFANVLQIVSQKCSGRRECEISVPDPDLEQTMPCLEGLKMFLEVRYSCVEGTLTFCLCSLLDFSANTQRDRSRDGVGWGQIQFLPSRAIICLSCVFTLYQ